MEQQEKKEQEKTKREKTKRRRKQICIVGNEMAEDNGKALSFANPVNPASQKRNPIIRYQTGDVIKMKKVHPCGSKEWEVLSPGVDYKLRCRGCGREIMIPRIELGRRIRQ